MAGNLHDLERGKTLGRVERCLSFVHIVFETKRYLLMFVILWTVFVAVVYGAHTSFFQGIEIHNATLPNIFPPSIFPTVWTPPHEIHASLNPIERLQWVQNNARQVVEAEYQSYQFGERLRDGPVKLSLLQIKKMMLTVAETEEVFCVAGPHIAVMHPVFYMNEEFYVNPSILGFDKARIQYEEESLFYPHKTRTMRRHQRVELEFQTVTGETSTKVFEDIEAVCVQHMIDVFNHVDFLNHKDEI